MPPPHGKSRIPDRNTATPEIAKPERIKLPQANSYQSQNKEIIHMRILFALTLVVLLTTIVTSAPAATADTGNPKVTMETSKGTMVIELYPKEAPKTVENFLAYVDDGFFAGTIFHRVIPGFVIQGGGFTADMERKETRKPIVNEADNGLKNLRGTLSMARTNNPDSATSQFFINLRDNAALDHNATSAGYAVFGKVIEGLDVIDAIAAVPTTTRGPYRDVPREPVVIKGVKR
jgi:cyclophilin family peptidyl-prolyl cis-trans isomerase